MILKGRKVKLTQGAFSYLPELTDDEIKLQIQYGLDNDWSIGIEFTDDPHPRNLLWEMWGVPLFDMKDPVAIIYEVNRCREAYPNYYIRVTAYDSSLGRQFTALSFIVNRPENEPGFRLERQDSHDRQTRYSLHAYSTDIVHGQRYSNET